jgi:hypothetical protein
MTERAMQQRVELRAAWRRRSFDDFLGRRSGWIVVGFEDPRRAAAVSSGRSACAGPPRLEGSPPRRAHDGVAHGRVVGVARTVVGLAEHGDSTLIDSGVPMRPERIERGLSHDGRVSCVSGAIASTASPARNGRGGALRDAPR